MNKTSFKDLGISAQILKAIDSLGYETPTPIQEECIPHVMSGKDLVGQAQTGTGKTAAFGIPAIEITDTGTRDTQVLVMCPTRELAIQVTGELIKLSTYVQGINVVPVYGGQPISRQLKALKLGAQIVVGTPGRLIDHLKRGTLQLGSLKMVVLDEADEMLNMGFRDDIEEILSYGKDKQQTVMFSATVPPAIKGIMKKFMNSPEMVTTEKQQIVTPGIDQFVMEVRDSVRTEAISRVLDLNEYKLALVFCNTKKQCDNLVLELQSRGYSCDVLHGDMSQALRDKVMGKFRRNDIDILVATDVAARGLDVENVDVVFNFDIPYDPEQYVHRIGRTGRAGREGVSITLASGGKFRRIRFIEQQIGQKLKLLPMPSVKDVQQQRITGLIGEVEKTLQAGGLRPFIEQIEAFSEGNYTTIEIAAALLKLKTGNIEADQPDDQQRKVRPGKQKSDHSKRGRKKAFWEDAPRGKSKGKRQKRR